MKEYIRIFNQLRSTSSRIEKEKILKDNENVPGFKELLQFIYDPLQITGLAKRKIVKEINKSSITFKIDNIFEAIKYVKKNNTGSDLVIETLQNWFSHLDVEEKEFSIQVLTKDMNAGFSANTLNKIYSKDFIKKFGVQLAGTYNPSKILFDEICLTLKIDGNRCTVFKYSDNDIRFYSRSGKQIEGLNELKKQFRYLPNDYVYDGEILALNHNNLKSKDLFQITQSIIRTKGEKKDLQFILFDAVSINDFNKGQSSFKYKIRKNNINDFIEDYKFTSQNSSFISIVPTFYQGKYDEKIISKYLNEVVSNGYEGLMINNMNGLYQCKRTSDLLKVKIFDTTDLLVIDINEDTRGGKCGSLTCKLDDYENTVNVAGLTEEQKNNFWNNPNDIIGKTIEVKYFEKTTNQNGGISLRFPSFVGIRDDK